ncbi:MAG: hypothetical protein QF476_10260, partial [Dehalococcoidia bacterium]|nr:hypothetical protein [Dehalococcoidia bacterium]
MGNYAEIANSCDRIENVLRRLIDNARKCNRFERITIVTPSNQSSFYLRRSLAKEGLFNVDFKRLED